MFKARIRVPRGIASAAGIPPGHQPSPTEAGESSCSPRHHFEVSNVEFRRRLDLANDAEALSTELIPHRCCFLEEPRISQGRDKIYHGFVAVLRNAIARA